MGEGGVSAGILVGVAEGEGAVGAKTEASGRQLHWRSRLQGGPRFARVGLKLGYSSRECG